MAIVDEHYNESSIKVVGAKSQVDFGIGANSMEKIFSLLRDQLYQNKPMAMVREILSNGRDAVRTKEALTGQTIENGLVVRAIDLSQASDMVNSHVPNDNNRFLFYLLPDEKQEKVIIVSFEDSGIGMSQETFEKVYTQYGETTKGTDNTQTGGFGLGAKTPFAYVAETNNKFLVDTCHKGIRQIQLIYIDETGKGKSALLATQDLGDESISFTKVQLWVPSSDDLKVLYNNINYIQVFWPKKEKAACVGYIWSSCNYSLPKHLDLEDLSVSEDFKEYGVKVQIIKNDFGSGTFPDSWLIVNIDGIAYPLTSKELRLLGRKDSLFSLDNKVRVVISMSNGLIIPHRSREILSMDKTTINIINDCLIESVDYQKDHLPALKNEFATKYHRLHYSFMRGKREVYFLDFLSPALLEHTFMKQINSWSEEAVKYNTILAGLHRAFYVYAYSGGEYIRQDNISLGPLFAEHKPENIVFLWEGGTKLSPKLQKALVHCEKKLVFQAKFNTSNWLQNASLEMRFKSGKFSSAYHSLKDFYEGLNFVDLFGYDFYSIDTSNDLTTADKVKAIPVKKPRMYSAKTAQLGDFDLLYIGKGKIAGFQAGYEHNKQHFFNIWNDELGIRGLLVINGNVGYSSITEALMKKPIDKNVVVNIAELKNKLSEIFRFSHISYWKLLDYDKIIFPPSISTMSVSDALRFPNELAKAADKKFEFPQITCLNKPKEEVLFDFALDKAKSNVSQYLFPNITKIGSEEEFFNLLFDLDGPTSPMALEILNKSIYGYLNSVISLNYSTRTNSIYNRGWAYNINHIKTVINFLQEDKEFLDILSKIQEFEPEYKYPFLDHITDDVNYFNSHSSYGKQWFLSMHLYSISTTSIFKIEELLIKLYDSKKKTISEYSGKEIGIVQSFVEGLHKREVGNITLSEFVDNYNAHEMANKLFKTSFIMNILSNSSLNESHLSASTELKVRASVSIFSSIANEVKYFMQSFLNKIIIQNQQEEDASNN